MTTWMLQQKKCEWRNWDCLRRMMNFVLMNLSFLFRWLLNACRNSAGVFFNEQRGRDDFTGNC